jgi:hypothetical protein
LSNPVRHTASVSIVVGIALALGAACTLNPNIPNARVLCQPDAPKCPSGFLCEKVEAASVPIGICCRTAHCTDGLTPDQIGGIVDAAVGAGLTDGGADGDTCVEEACTTNPGAPCFEGRI